MDDIQSAPKNTLWEREKQLRLWDSSETNSASSAPRDRTKSIVKFQDGCVFLAACSSGDTKEVTWLLGRGADINTANVDGLTALHQACIDDNLSMVKFLVERGADIDACDNEGWTALHATASCGFVDIARYLIDKGARLDAVNNDGELAIDLAEGKQMEMLLSNAIEKQGIDAEAARKEEEEIMLRDANQWLNSGCYAEQPHPKTGAVALHVAAAKGYIKVIKLLIEAGADVNAKDFDGWTPLHAAAHWGQDEACKILAENFGNLSAITSAGQTPIDLADPDVEILLEELKKKQDMMKKDMENRNKNSDLIREISPGKFGPRRSSITRLSVDQRQILAQKNMEDERVHLHSVLDQVSEDAVLGTETESESAQGKTDSESADLVPPSPSKTKPAMQENGDGEKHAVNQNSNSSTAMVNGLSSTMKKSVADELSKPETTEVDKKAKPDTTSENKTQVTTTAIASSPTTTTTTQSSVSTTKLAAIGRQAATLGQKTLASDTAISVKTGTSSSVVPQQVNRVDDAPAMWRSGLRKTESADVVCPTTTNERNDLDKLSRSSSVSFGPPSRANTIAETTSLRRAGSAVGPDFDQKEAKPRVESPAFQQQITQSSLPSTGDRVTDLYARYKAQLMGRSTTSSPSNGIVAARPNTPVITSTSSSRLTPTSVSTAVTQQSSRQLPSVQWLRRQKPDQDTNVDDQSRSSVTSNVTSSTYGGISRRTIDLLKRDEEKEIERKARAKRARESRRSTQGVSKEDLEKAGASLQAAAAGTSTDDEPAPAPAPAADPAPASVPTPTPATSAADRLSSSFQEQRSMSLTDEDDPLKSYRKSRESASYGDGSSTFTTGFMRSLRDAGLAAALANSAAVSSVAVTASSSIPKSTATSSSISTIANSSTTPVVTTSSPTVVRATAENSLPGNSSEDGDDSAVLSAAARARRRRESRRPPITAPVQGVSQDAKSDSVTTSAKSDSQITAADTTTNRSSESSVVFRANRLPVTCLAVTGCSYSLAPSSSAAGQSATTTTATNTTTSPLSDEENRYKKLYEMEQQSTDQLRNELREVRRELTEKCSELDRVRDAATASSSDSTAERREKRALERKISELEEELKELQSLRTENQRLRDENGALIRVISKLSK